MWQGEDRVWQGGDRVWQGEDRVWQGRDRAGGDMSGERQGVVIGLVVERGRVDVGFGIGSRFGLDTPDALACTTLPTLLCLAPAGCPLDSWGPVMQTL